MQLTGRDGRIRPMGPAIDIKAAGTANPLTAIMVEANRFEFTIICWFRISSISRKEQWRNIVILWVSNRPFADAFPVTNLQYKNP
jgi:hypothetical protein